MKIPLCFFLALLCTVSAEAQFAEPNDRGVTFNHMHLVVADLELHKRLWPELFGAELVEKQGYTAVRVTNALIFFRNAEPTASSADTSIHHFGLDVRDMESVLSKWREFGYEIDLQETGASGQSVAQITMPGGVTLALSEVPELAASASFSHVQFVTPFPHDLVSWYEKFFGANAVTTDDEDAAAHMPGATLNFAYAAEARMPTDGAAIDHIGFEVTNWEATIEMLEQAQIEFEFGPFHVESLDIWVAFFNDPSGALVEISHGLDTF